MSLTVKNIIVNAYYYLLTLVLLPAGVLWIERRLGVDGFPFVALRSVAIIVCVVVLLQYRKKQYGGANKPVQKGIIK